MGVAELEEINRLLLLLVGCGCWLVVACVLAGAALAPTAGAASGARASWAPLVGLALLTVGGAAIEACAAWAAAASAARAAGDWKSCAPLGTTCCCCCCLGLDPAPLGPGGAARASSRAVLRHTKMGTSW